MADRWVYQHYSGLYQRKSDGAALVNNPRYPAVWAAAYVRLMGDYRTPEESKRMADDFLSDLLDIEYVKTDTPKGG
jgi:hypothetical protein